SINKVDANVKDSLKLTTQAERFAENSNLIIGEMAEEINGIAQTSQQINSITDLINGISEKTRLLSLNAAIEASRAGESGKGFNVVASEIRKLAIQSNEAANEIGVLIKMNDKRIKSGVAKTSEVINAINDIKSSIKSIKDMIEQIYKSTEQESKGSQTIMEIIDSFAEESMKNVKSIEALGKTRNHLSMEVQKMRNLILAFKVQGVEKEVIKDIKIYTKEEKEKIALDKRLKKQQKIEEKLENKKKNETQKSTMLSSSKDLVNYKPTAQLLKKQKRSKPATKEKKKKRVRIPQDITIEKFDKNIIEKIQKQEDKDFVFSVYKKDVYSKIYSLKSKLVDKDKIRLESILEEIDY
ncbi:MAG TPA: methyl-accepting chemotaxis protein, partial [Spirochaetota bacterium]|nr:methyl-accepting chemotaxis protein [Spirochaetota bacterium]